MTLYEGYNLLEHTNYKTLIQWKYKDTFCLVHWLTGNYVVVVDQDDGSDECVFADNLDEHRVDDDLF